MGRSERWREKESGRVGTLRKSGGAKPPFARARQQAGSPFRKAPLSLVRGEGGEPRRPQHDRRPHWSTRLLWVGLRKNWRGEKSPLNSCGYGCEKLESAQPASSTRRIALNVLPVRGTKVQSKQKFKSGVYDGVSSLRDGGRKK